MPAAEVGNALRVSESAVQYQHQATRAARREPVGNVDVREASLERQFRRRSEAHAAAGQREPRGDLCPREHASRMAEFLSR